MPTTASLFAGGWDGRWLCAPCVTHASHNPPISRIYLCNRYGTFRISFPQSQPLTIDLATFSCGQSRLGAAVSANDYFSNALRTKDTFVDERNGVELGTARDVLDSVFVTLKSFSGKFTKAGKAIDLNARTTEAQILALFGEPYWTDRSDGEVIMFYEYERGTTELQFEFTDGRALSFITLSRNGVLSTEEQRKHYKVTKPWPPK